VKRLIDFVAALLALLIFSPLLAILAVLVRLKLGSPVLFRQQRPGLDGKPFMLIKFRTMREALGPDGQPLPDEDRLTGFGKWLRATSFDELPELWNVLRGDMSFVGPRPLLMHYLPLYSPEQMRRHEVRPGLTGWAQVNGRNSLDWEEKFRLDVWYVDNQSLGLDLKILFLTASSVLRSQGISYEGSATMPYFTGTRPKQDSAEKG
jgi:lipopolysaccharide/colanic/teichoic acid biosynthesis glycosyltransferase